MLLALALCVLGSPDFTVHVEGGYTNSERHVAIPQWPPGTTGVHLRVDHDARLRFGWETSGDGGASWQAHSWISAGWFLRAGNQRLAHARLSQFVDAGGACVPFDLTLDWSGDSGGSVRVLRETSGEADLTIAQVMAGVHISTQARSAWSVEVTVPSGSFGSVNWLNEVQWTADIEGEWIP
jgi:hypothetical protein